LYKMSSRGLTSSWVGGREEGWCFYNELLESFCLMMEVSGKCRGDFSVTIKAGVLSLSASAKDLYQGMLEHGCAFGCGTLMFQFFLLSSSYAVLSARNF